MTTIRLKPLAEQVMVVTGATSGIGLVTARRAARDGASVVLVARNGSALHDLAADLTAAGATVHAIAADVGDPAAVARVAAGTIERFGRIDSWVNAAGVAIYAPLMDTPDDEHARLFRTNYFGTVHAAKAAIPHLSAGGGALIIVGSIAGDIASPVMGAYAASKHAVRAYVQALRIELRAGRVPVSATLVKPSGIDTPIAQHAAVHIDGAAQVPPPAYDPDLVADAILDAAQHPRREITVGGAGRAQVLFAEHFPALFEMLAPIIARGFVAKDRAQPQPDNLDAPAGPGRERSGELTARTHSLYSAAALHPKSVLAAIGIAGAAVALLALGGSARKSRTSE